MLRRARLRLCIIDQQTGSRDEGQNKMRPEAHKTCRSDCLGFPKRLALEGEDALQGVSDTLHKLALFVRFTGIGLISFSKDDGPDFFGITCSRWNQLPRFRPPPRP